MRFLALILFVTAAFVFAQAAMADGTASSNCCSGLWAASGKPPYVEPHLTPSEIPAPKGMISIKAVGSHLSGNLVVVGRKRSVRLRQLMVNPPLTEVLWSPDSRNFVINVSDGGLVGGWDTYFYSLDQDEYPVFRDVESLIRPLADTFPHCDDAEEPNIGAAAWLENGKELLLVAQAPPHSSCRNMGAIVGFRISVDSWKVIERIPENELRKKWGKILGCMIADCPVAPDPTLKRAKPLLNPDKDPGSGPEGGHQGQP